MAIPYETGGGSPWSFTGFPTSLTLEVGAGDIPGGYDAGAGDPLVLADDVFTLGTPGWPVSVSVEAVTQEGGYILWLTRTSDRWSPSVSGFNVKIRSVASGTLYPIAEVGAYSGVMGSGTSCRTYSGGYSLQFVTPPLPVDENYDIVVTTPEGSVVQLSGLLHVWPMQECQQVEAMRRLPSNVYTKARGGA